MPAFADLRYQLKTYMSPEAIAIVQQAYDRAKDAHTGQKRSSGEDYITHPTSVAIILAHHHMDKETIMAALLHDVLEDTNVDKKTLATAFGDQVAELVDGVSKLTQMKFSTRAEAQAENFRKMVLAMVRDIRVILVKLADRLHNMRTLSSLSAAKQRRIAIETLEIYAPIANRLGMHDFKREYQDLGFQAIYPLRHRILAAHFQKREPHVRELESQVLTTLKTKLQPSFKQLSVLTRDMSLVHIYKRMRLEKVSFEEALDKYCFQVILPNAQDCYLALGLLHQIYKPVPDGFRDYIAIPKANGYQSLHTTLFGPAGMPIQIQLRSQDMDKIAHLGIVAYWRYENKKNMGEAAQHRAQTWLKDLLEIQQSTGSSMEFIENVKSDLFPDEVYVFTPQGDIMELPRGSTPVDFAYAIHSDVGNTCVAARINRHLAPLSTTLSNGQTIEIITAVSAAPSALWLNFAVTGKARSNIRHYLKGQHRIQSINLGREMINKALENVGLTWDTFSKPDIHKLLKALHYKTTDDLFANTGLGNQLPQAIACQLAQKKNVTAPDNTAIRPHALTIKGSQGMVVTFAPCCCPIPGDPIVGFLSRGQGLMIHHHECTKIRDFKGRVNEYVNVRWEDNLDADFTVTLNIQVRSQRGVLAQITQAIAQADANIENVSVQSREGRYSWLEFSLQVRNRVHLARTMRRIRALRTVMKINRGGTSRT